MNFMQNIYFTNVCAYSIIQNGTKHKKWNMPMRGNAGTKPCRLNTPLEGPGTRKQPGPIRRGPETNLSLIHI